MPCGAECFCLLMVYLKVPEKKKEIETQVWRDPSDRLVFRMGRKNQHAVAWLRSSAALGMGLQAGDPLALQISSPTASCALQMAEEDPLGEPGWEQDAPASAVISRGAQPSAARKPTQLSFATQADFIVVLTTCPGFGWDRVNFLFSSW